VRKYRSRLKKQRRSTRAKVRNDCQFSISLTDLFSEIAGLVSESDFRESVKQDVPALAVCHTEIQCTDGTKGLLTVSNAGFPNTLAAFLSDVKVPLQRDNDVILRDGNTAKVDKVEYNTKTVLEFAKGKGRAVELIDAERFCPKVCDRHQQRLRFLRLASCW
jgi:hypothetical protein